MANIYDLTDTWNSAGTSYTAIKMDVTNTASAATSKLMDLLIGGSSRFNVDLLGRPNIYGANMSVMIGNGGWGGTNFALPYLRPSSSGGHIAFDVMPNGGPDDVWIDICSTDIVADSTNYETLKLYKAYNGDAYVRTTKAGSGTKRSLQIGGATTKFTSGASDTLAWTIDASGHLTANAAIAPQIFAGLVTNSTLASIGSTSSNSSGFYTTNGFDWGYTRAGSAMWLSAFNTLRLAPNVTLAWSGSAGDPSASSDAALARVAAGVVKVSAAGGSTAGAIVLDPKTVANLPSASTAGTGALAVVTDANATTARTTVAGGGSNKVLVMSDGTNWKIVA